MDFPMIKSSKIYIKQLASSHIPIIRMTQIFIYLCKWALLDIKSIPKKATSGDKDDQNITEQSLKPVHIRPDFGQ